MKKAKVAPSEIAALAVTGHGNGMYLVGPDGRPSHDGINSADSRAADYVARWYTDGTFERILPRTCQSIWAAQPAALLAWFRDHEPEVLARTRWILMCKDYVRYRLTGEAFAEVTDYSGLNLMNVKDLVYDPDVLAAFGISDAMEKLPPLRQSGEICGRVTEKAAKETGLAAGTPVAGGLFDITACAIGTGITSPEKLCLIAGSWSINEYISPSPVQDHDLFMTSAYCMPGYWLISEASATSASNLEWVVSELMAGERREAQASGRSVFDTVNAMVDGISPADSDVLFLPFLYGSNAGPRASAGFLGLHGWHGKAHMLRAVYEGVVFSHKTHMDRLLGHRGPAQAARIAGGAARSSVWVQMFADVLQIPIELTSCEELGAMGAAIVRGRGCRPVRLLRGSGARDGARVPHRGPAPGIPTGVPATSTGATGGISTRCAAPGDAMDDLQLMVSVARMYYQQGLKQEEIAKRVKVSRASISLILAEARRSGIVEITIRNPLEDNAELSRDAVRPVRACPLCRGADLHP